MTGALTSPLTGTAQSGSEPHAGYVTLDRREWAALRGEAELTLGPADVSRLRGLGEPVDAEEVAEVYLPLVRLLLLQVAARSRLGEATSAFLGTPVGPSPFVVGIAGSVAVGKSTTGRLLRELLARSPGHPSVALVPTDGFLLPNAELERRGLMARKGWPESYDTRALLRFLADVRAGQAEVTAPGYSHLTYDVVPDAPTVVRRPEILLVEGLTVLQPPAASADGRPRMAVSDYFDTSLYVDADVADLRAWYVQRFLALRDSAFRQPGSYFARYAGLDDDEAAATAAQIWSEVNEPNLVANILPTRGRAAVVLEKGPDHRVRRVRLRR